MYIVNEAKHIWFVAKHIGFVTKPIFFAPKHIVGMTVTIFQTPENIGFVAKNICSGAKNIDSALKNIGFGAMHIASMTMHTRYVTKNISAASRNIGFASLNIRFVSKHIDAVTKTLGNASRRRRKQLWFESTSDLSTATGRHVIRAGIPRTYRRMESAATDKVAAMEGRGEAPKAIPDMSPMAGSETFDKACALWDRGSVKEALRLFLIAAKEGDVSSQLNVAYFYEQGRSRSRCDVGIGVRKNLDQALIWYRRAYRRGSASAANNIGTIYRDRGQTRMALQWFNRALKRGDVDSSLEIAKVYISMKGRTSEAIDYLRLVTRSKQVTEATAEEAKRLKMAQKTHR
jgi:TPR repeat protein